MTGGSAEDRDLEGGRVASLIAPLRLRPERSAVLTDVDGTIAPIEDDPSAASVPEGTRTVLRALAKRYALVGCLSGRRALDARRVVGLDELAYSGNHGYELLLPGDTEPRPDPSLEGHETDASRFVGGLDRNQLERSGIRIEDKDAIVALHWRGAPNEAAAESLSQEIASEAERDGLIAHRGRKVLEIRPNVAIDKGVAVAALIPAHSAATSASAGSIDHALYGGDDRTDVDAFAALRTLQEQGELETAVCIAVASDESPPEVSESADLTVAGPEGFGRVLEALAE